MSSKKIAASSIFDPPNLGGALKGQRKSDSIPLPRVIHAGLMNTIHGIPNAVLITKKRSRCGPRLNLFPKPSDFFFSR
jgi:hypothetical protein